MPLAPTPKGVFSVRDPLDEVLDRAMRRLAALGGAETLEPLRETLHAAAHLARERLAAEGPPSGSRSDAAAGSEAR